MMDAQFRTLLAELQRQTEHLERMALDLQVARAHLASLDQKTPALIRDEAPKAPAVPRPAKGKS